MVDGIKLFDSTATIFDTNGLGGLPDAISCQVEEILNGEFEMEMEYPVNGLRYSELLLRRIIFAKSEPDSTGQPFRIYAISKPINGIVTINAHHISYDLSGYPVKPFTAPDIQTALTRLKSYSAKPHPFAFTSDKNITSPINIKKPVSTRVALGGMEGSLLDTYRGEYEFDKFSVKLHTKRGADRGVSIRYGKNLTDIKQDENCSNVHTGVYPYWFSEEEGLVELSEKIILTPGTFNYVKVLALDFTEKFQEIPTQAELRTVAESYISSHNIGVPDVSIDVQFEPLMQSNEYANFAILETVKLGDTVTVGFPEMGIQASAKCVKTIFNVLTSKYETLSLGSIKSNLASTIAGQSQAISEKPSAQIIDVIKAAVFEKVSIEQLDALDVRITNLVVDNIQAANVKITQLESDYADLDAVVSNTIDTVDLNTTNLEAMNAIIQELNVTYATIASLEALKIVVETLEGEYGQFNILVTNKLNAHAGTFETILTNEAIAELITTGKLIAGSTIFADGAIGSAQIQSLDVAKLNGGIISTAKFIVQGSDGKLKIQDNRLQVFDNALIPFERVALGDIYGDGSVYALRVRGADGETVLFNEDGQTKEGFTDGYDKLEPNSLDPKNIDINRVIVRVNEDGTETIKGSKVVIGNENLEVKFTSIDTSIGDNLNSAKEYADTKAGEAQTAAESYAKTKAEAERVLAESYADGIVDDEEQARITDVNAKLTAAKTHAETKANDAKLAAQNYSDGQLADYATTMVSQIDSIQGQIDGSITTWFYPVPPTLLNEPASNWNTTDDKNVHLGDLYYDTISGYCYRWQVINNAYSWQRITDTDVTKALEDSSKAQDTADSKRRVFVATPTVPYDKGDLWAQGTTGELMRCKTSRSTGSYIASDWEKASKYTDDSTANTHLATAKTYAETKATEAKTAAESYAKTKAEAERVLAESYADGIVDDEEQARITDANAKLTAAKTHADTKATAAENAAKTYADLKKTEAISDSNNYTDGKITPITSTVSTQGTQITAIQGQITNKVWQTDITQALEPVDAQLGDIDEQLDGQNTTMLHMGAELTLLKDNISMSVSELEIQTSGLTDKTALLEGDLENLQNEYDDSMSNVDTRILSQSAEIDVMANEISSKVSKTEYDATIGEVNQNYVELKQGYDDFKLTIQDGGGSNIIRNSVGYGQQNFWTVESGTINPGQSTWILDGIAKYGWMISTGTMVQSIDILPTTDYTISGRLLKATTAGTVLIGLYDIETNLLINTVISKGAETFNGKFSLQFSSLNTKKYNIRIKVLNASTVTPVEITDLMLAQGHNYDVWSQANGEIYTLNVRMDGKGINVYSSDGAGKTVMSPEEFAGYYNNQKIFTLNGDITEVMGLSIGGKGLYIPPVKFVQTQDRLDVVWTGS